MDRKGPRSSKPKNVPPRDLFALGSKASASSVSRSSGINSSSNSSADSQQGSGEKSYGGKGSGTVSDRSRDVKSASKKLGQRSNFIGASSLSRQISQKTPTGDTSEEWELIAEDVDLENLIPFLEAAEERKDTERIEAYLCGAVKTLKSQRLKPDNALCLTLVYLSKVKPGLFINSPIIVEALCNLLKRGDISVSFKSKNNSSIPILAANILLAAFQEVKCWPEILVRVYIDDSLGERLWVDHEDCKGLVENIIASFNTKVPPKNMLFNEFGIGGRSDCPSPPITHSTNVDTGDSEMEISFDSKETSDVTITNRYAHISQDVEQLVKEAVQAQLNLRHPNVDAVTRNYIRFLSTVCGIQDVRKAVAPKLDMWIQKHHRIATELLLALCMNCNTHSMADQELIRDILHIRLKQHKIYMICLRELLNAHADNIYSVMKDTIFNELSNKRNSSNMAILAVVFLNAPDQAATILADIFIEILRSSREDFLRALRGLLREIVRSLRHDMPFQTFCQGLMKEQKDLRDMIEFKDRIFHNISDLICLTLYASISPQVKESISPQARPEARDVEPLKKHQELVANIQQDAVHWLYRIVPKSYSPSKEDFNRSLHKILMMSPVEAYHQVDGWPTDSERVLYYRLTAEVPVKEEVLHRLLAIGNMKDQFVKPQELVELIEKLLRRVTSLNQDITPMLQVDDIKVIEMIFNLCAYIPPENAPLPQDYRAPKTAISNVYWKAWTILLLITAHNPAVFGICAWDTYPTLRVMMEMCITNCFVFPPPTMSIGDRGEDMMNEDLVLGGKERQQILEFESHLAQKTITEQNSLLVSQLITMDPKGPARKPPVWMKEQLEALNSSSKVGHLLCRSREPDFLLDIIQRQGAPRGMPWLSELVQNSEDSFSSLPVQCLCEFLLSETVMTSESSITSMHHRLLKHLRTLLSYSDEEAEGGFEIMEYFLRRLSSEQPLARTQAIRGLNLLVAPINDAMEVDSDCQHPFNWLLIHVPTIPTFSDIRIGACNSLRAACQIETQPHAVSAYIRFLAVQTANDPIDQMALLVHDMAQLIVERTTMTAAILPVPETSHPMNFPHAQTTVNSLYRIFLNYMKSVRTLDETVSWPENQDHVRVQWASGEQAVMHILVVHAMVILLIFGPSASPELFQELLEMWFPRDHEMPQAFLVDTTQEALLLPDWLKLKMIRSSVPQLVDAALRDLEPSQLVLFIQSFGIPVVSMTRLLCALDLAVNTSEESVTAAVLDKSHKTYMSQLVEVQNHRGAQGGGDFARILVEKEESETSTDPPVVLKRLVGPLTTERKQPMELCTSKVKSFIGQCFTSSSLHKEHSQQVHETMRVLRQLLSKEIMQGTEESSKPYLNELLRSLTSIIRSEDVPMASFVDGLHLHWKLSVRLFRQLLQMKEKFECAHIYSLYVQVVSALRQANSSVKSPLTPIFRSFNLQRQNALEPVEVGDLTSLGDLACEQVVLQKLIASPWHLLEKLIKQLVELGMKQGKLGTVVNAIAQLLATKFQPTNPLNIPGQHYALLLDWLQVLDPELCLVPWDLTKLLLFGGEIQSCDNQSMDIEGSRGTYSGISSQSYLLASFIHQATWQTIGTTITKLLDKCEPHLDPAAVLDFLNAVLRVPKLWQGRERRTPRHAKQSLLLDFSGQQIITLSQYIFMECQQTGAEETSISKCEHRIPLLFFFLGDDRNALRNVVRHLLTYTESKKTFANDILYQIYLQRPSVGKYLSESHHIRLIEVQTKKVDVSQSSGDVSIHTLITMLTSPQPGKDFIRRMQDLEAALRKMTSSHPLLILRHLSLIASALQGLGDMTLHALHTKNYTELFSMVLGLLELLQPYIFLPKYHKPFCQIIDCFVELFDALGRPKDLTIILNRLCQLLLSWVGAGGSYASSYISQHANLLASLLWKHADPPLRSLAAIAASRGSDDSRDLKLTTSIFNRESVDAISQLGECEGPPLSFYDHKRIRSLQTDFENQLTSDQFYNLLSSVAELADYSLDHGLTYFTKPLSEGILNASKDVRVNSWNLMVKLLRIKPKLGSQMYASVLSALDHEDVTIAGCAVNHLPEVILYLHEYAPELLTAAFTVCLSGETSTADTLSEALFLLTISTGA